MTRETTVRGDPSPLADQVERQNRELKTLLEIAQNLTLALDLETLLGVMLDQMKRVIDYEGATILVRRGDDLVPRAYRGPADPVAVMARHYRVDEPSSRRVLESRRPIIVHDMQTDETIRAWMSPTARPLFDGPFRYIRGWMSAPLIYQEEAVGILVVHHTEPGAFSERQAGTAMAFASQAAVAVTNARLYAQAQELAALKERHRLAYELHDSVSQALYGITLGAQTAQERCEIRTRTAGRGAGLCAGTVRDGSGRNALAHLPVAAGIAGNRGLASRRWPSEPMFCEPGLNWPWILLRGWSQMAGWRSSRPCCGWPRRRPTTSLNTPAPPGSKFVSIRSANGWNWQSATTARGLIRPVPSPAIWACIRCASGLKRLAGRLK
jgi:GAF domain-containing protein